MTANAALLEVSNLCVSYGRLTALRDVSLTVSAGEIVCLIGPNGAGKSSAFAAIAGGVVANAGSIKLDGREILGMKPEAIARLGLSLVPEGRHVFPQLTVEENLRVGTYMSRDRATLAAGWDLVFHLFPRLAERRTSHAGRLSGGEQQMLVIARALLTHPRLLLVDEPSLGLAPKIVDQVYEALLNIRRERGLTMFLNEQSSNRLLRYADRIYVIRGGHIQLHGHACDLQDGAAIRQAYFGFGGTAGDAVKENVA